jgi:hypothetical protein
MPLISFTRLRCAITIAIALGALALSAAFVAPVAEAGVPFIEHPAARVTPEEHEPYAPNLCEPDASGANCGTGSHLGDYVLGGLVLVFAVGVVRSLVVA